MANFSSHEYRMAPKVILEGCDNIAVVKNPVAGETFSAFTAKIVAAASMSAADVIFTDVPTDVGRGVGTQQQVNGKSATRSGEADDLTDDICIVCYDSVGQLVHFVQDANDIDITLSNPTVNIPAIITMLRNPTPRV